jgi:hypothetical protein
MLEYGLRLGLAADMQYDKRIQDLRYNEEAMRRAKGEQEAKAKMFADDFDYKNAMNTHDNPLVKQAAQFNIKRIGSFINSNPDWETNVQKRAQYQQLLRELKDNPDLNRGLQTDDAFEKMNTYAKDPKNSDLVNSKEDWGRIEQEKTNYLKWGNQDGEEAAKKDGKKAFQFRAPEEKVDTAKILIEAAKNADYDEIHYFGNQGHKQSISNSRKNDAVEHAIASNYWGRYLKKDYNNYLDQLVGNEKTNAKTINQFVRERMNPYFKADEIDKGFAPESISNRGGKGDKPMSPSLWEEMHNKALMESIRTKGKPSTVELNPEAMQRTFGNKYGEMPLENVKSPFGEPLNLGMRDASATGLITVGLNPSGKLEGSHKVFIRLPIEDFYSLGGQYQKVIDEGGVGQLTPGGPSNQATNWSIHEKYQGDFKKFTDKTGKDFVEFPVQQKYDPMNPQLAFNYANAHNAKAHEEDPYSGTQTSNVVSDDGKWIWNGNDWIENK